MHTYILALLLTGFVGHSEEVQRKPGYVYKTCAGWGYGYSGTFSCPGEYSGATRTCEFVEVRDGREKTIDSWVEEGCATGATAAFGYCVQYCRD